MFYLLNYLQSKAGVFIKNAQNEYKFIKRLLYSMQYVTKSEICRPCFYRSSLWHLYPIVEVM